MSDMCKLQIAVYPKDRTRAGYGIFDTVPSVSFDRPPSVRAGIDLQQLQDLWYWLVSVGPQISKAWEGVAAVIAFATFVVSFIFVSRTTRAPQPGNQVVVTLTADDLAALVESRLPKSTKDTSQVASVEELKRSLDYVAAQRKLLEPPALTAESFPKELDVYGWTPGKSLQVRISTPLGARIFEGLFCLAHYLIFPGLAGSFVLGGLAPGYAGYIGAALGLGLWVRNNRRGRILKLDFEKKKYSVSSPAAWTVFPNLPREVWVKEGAVDGQPTLTLGIEQFAIANAPANPASRLKLAAFANCLLWAMQRQIEVASGVYIGKPGWSGIAGFPEEKAE